MAGHGWLACGDWCVCVCARVCVTLGIIGILSDCFRFDVLFYVLQQGDMACVQGPCPTKLPDARDMRADHSHVPAIFLLSEMARG